MDELEKNTFEICINISRWFEAREYRGNDPYQIDEKFFKFRYIPFLAVLRSMLKPFHSIVPSWIFASQKPILIPKALGLILSGNCDMHRYQSDERYLKENGHLIELLKGSRNPLFKHSCWGWPFEWGGAVRYKKNSPLVCVTCPIGHGILDHFNITEESTYLELGIDVGQYLMSENGFQRFNSSLCLYYSPQNKELAFNSNIMAASFILRLNKIAPNDSYTEFAYDAINFVIDGQNDDGSWYYTYGGSEKNTDKTIDNRHTGFVLEHLEICNQYVQDSKIANAIEKGWQYYQKNLFDGIIPKWNISQVYPVDIHDVSQGIITALTLGKVKFSEEIIKWAIKNFSNQYDEFYYKLMQNGGINKTVFIRWNQAWMYRALASWLNLQKDSIKS